MAAQFGALKGKTALVTGGAQRLGRATVLALAASGADVVVHYATSRAAAESAVSEARALGVQAWAVQADLSSAEDCAKLFADVVEAAGPVDCLVNNASIFPAQKFAELDEATLSENLRVNALAPMLLAKALHAQGRSGAVVNLLDTRILDYDKEHVPYHLSKRTLFTLTKLMALEFAPTVRVNAVAPGLVLPPPGKDEAYIQGLAGSLPLQRSGGADDVAEAALFLLAGGFITGQVVYVDGGRHLWAQLYG